MDRADFNGGPAYFVFDGVTWQITNDNWEAETEIVTIPVTTNLQGKLGEREDYSITRVKATPVAFTASLSTLLTKLFPHQPSNIGALLFGSSDKPGVIQTQDGRSITYSAGGMLNSPDLQFCAGMPLIASDAEWVFLRKNNTAASDAGAHVVDASSAYTQPGIDPTDIVNSTYTLSWGASAPFDDIECDENGVKFSVKRDWEELKTWNDGLLNYRLKNVEASVTFTPINIDSADFNDALLLVDGSSAGRGKFLSARGQELTVLGAAAGDPKLVIKRATPTKGRLRFGGPSRVGEIEMSAQRHYESSALQALFSLGVVPA